MRLAGDSEPVGLSSRARATRPESAHAALVFDSHEALRRIARANQPGTAGLRGLLSAPSAPTPPPGALEACGERVVVLLKLVGHDASVRVPAGFVVPGFAA